MSGPLLRDARWVRQSFLVQSDQLENVDLQNRTFTTASLKFTDTTPGGNFAINPPPQFTRFADLRVPGRFTRNQGDVRNGRGLGRYYSEALDDNAQIIHMRFGVPQFSSMDQFFAHFYNSAAGQLARTGRAASLFYYLGRAAGFVVSVMSWKVLAFHMLGAAARFFLSNNNSSKYYYLKPAMPLYWNAVTTMVNHMAVNRGIIPRVGDKTAQQFAGAAGNQATISQLHDLLPDIFKENGGIDVYALANRAQRLARKHYKKMEEVFNAAESGMTHDELALRIQQLNVAPLDDDKKPYLMPMVDAQGNSIDSTKGSYMEKWLASQVSKPKDSSAGSSGVEAAIDGKDGASSDGFWQFLAAELDDGGAFASFRVNATGAVQESFTNTAGDSDIATKINGMSAQSRNTSFSFANGNVSGGVMGKMIGGAVQAAMDVGRGLMDQLSISGLAVLGGAAFVDIPKHWQSSMAQLPRGNYTIQLVSPYGNPISQLLNIYIPLSMLLAGALPLSTGRQSYTSPFLLELYDQGRCQTRLGMIDSLSISRGTSNLGFNNDGHAMAIDVTFSVVDLSSIMHMPISEGFSFGVGAKVGAIVGGAGGAVAGGVPGAVIGGSLGAAIGGAADLATEAFNGIFADDNAFTDYMAVLAGMGVADQIYQWRKLKLNFTRVRANWDSFWSASRMAAFAGDSLPGRVASAVFSGTYRDGPNLLRPAQGN